MMRPYVVRPRIDFPDVPEGHPFYDAVQYLAQNGIVNGYANGLFGVGDAVLRAQLAKMVVVAFGVHDAAIDSMGDAAFLDVPYTGDAYPFDFVQEAYAAGYFVGYQDGTFRPYARLTRVQLVRVVVRAAGAALAGAPGRIRRRVHRRESRRCRRGGQGTLQRAHRREDRDHLRPVRHGHARSHGQGPL